MKRAILAAAMLFALFAPAEARRYHVRASSSSCASSDIMRPCSASETPGRAVSRKHPAALRRQSLVQHNSGGGVIGGRPPGCPSQFCGCGASLHLFGRIIPSLNLAANWYRFPRTSPAPKMAGVRRHHVFVLEQHVSGDVWMVFDANSGGHATRMHARSIAGYTIVNPQGAL